VVVAVAVVFGGAPGGAQDQSGPISSEAQELIRLLDAEDLSVRQEAFLRLEALREPATASVVRAHLASRDPNTRAFSVRAIAAIEGPSAVPTLLKSLKRDRHAFVRLESLLALEPLWEQEPTIGAAFIAALRDRHAQVRMAAVDAVSRIDEPEAHAAIRTRWRRERHRDVRRVLEEAMKRLGERL